MPRGWCPPKKKSVPREQNGRADRHGRDRLRLQPAVRGDVQPDAVDGEHADLRDAAGRTDERADSHVGVSGSSLVTVETLPIERPRHDLT